MADWRDQFTEAEIREFTEHYGEAALADVTPCHACGVPTPYNLLDAKPEPGADQNSDFTRLECRGCYGPNWEPT